MLRPLRSMRDFGSIERIMPKTPLLEGISLTLWNISKKLKNHKPRHLSSTGVKSQHRLTSQRRIFSTVFLLVFSCVTNHWFPVAGWNACMNQNFVLLWKCQIFYRHWISKRLRDPIEYRRYFWKTAAKQYVYHSVYFFAKYSIRACFPPSGKQRLSVLSTRKVTGPKLSNIGQLVCCQRCLNSLKELSSIEYMKVLSIASLTRDTGSGREDQPQCKCCRCPIKRVSQRGPCSKKAYFDFAKAFDKVSPRKLI